MALAVSDKFQNLPEPILGVPQSDWFHPTVATTCMTSKCNTQFGFITRKHHCRSCGSVVCHLCLQSYRVKVGDSTTVDKVCTDCVQLKRLVQCRDCNDRLEARGMGTHSEQECSHRLVDCSAGCGSPKLKQKDLSTHLTSSCTRRQVPCQDGCGASVPFHTMQAHLKDSCSRRTACSRGCGVLVGPSLTKEHAATCTCRPVTCPACMATCPFRELDSHRSSTCPKRLITCPLSCGSRVAAVELDNHTMNLCARRVLSCKECGDKYVCCEEDDHLDNACDNRKQCELGCGAMVLPARAARHQSTKCTYRKVKCDVCNESVQFNVLNEHKTSQCSHRVVRCSLACGITGLKQKDLEGHQINACPNRPVSCPDGCGSKLRFCDRKEHLTSTCSNRTPCSAGCGALVALSLVNDHRANSCGHRLVSCDTCGAAGIKFVNLSTHKTTQCTQRMVTCTKGCGKSVKAADLDLHERTQCPNRLVVCTLRCGEMVPMNDMTAHHNKSCEARVTCATCSQSVTRCKLQQHDTAICCRYCPNNHQLRLTSRAVNSFSYKCDICKKDVPTPRACVAAYSMCCESCDYDVCNSCTPAVTVSCPHCKGSISAKTSNTHMSGCTRYPVECDYCPLKFPRNEVAAHERSCPRRPQQVGSYGSSGGGGSGPTVVIQGPESISVKDVSANYTVDTPTDHHKLAFVCHCLRRTGADTDIVYRHDYDYTIRSMAEYVRIIEHYGFGQNPKMLEVRDDLCAPSSNRFVEISSTQALAALRGSVGVVTSYTIGTVVMLYTKHFYENTVVKPMARQGSSVFAQYARRAGIRF